MPMGMQANTMTRNSAYLTLYAAMSLVGVYIALAKPLTAALPVFLLALIRFAIAAVAMIPWLPRAPGEAPLSGRDKVRLFWLSFLGNFLFSICMLFGVKLSSAVAAGIILSLIPAAVALLSWLFLHERPSRRVLIALALAVAAIGFVNLAKTPAHAGDTPVSWLGNALLLGAVFCEGCYVVIGKALIDTVSAKRMSALINLCGLLLMLPFGLWQAQDFAFAAVPWSIWGLLAFYALAASQWSVWMWMSGIKHVPASQAAVFTVALPIAAALVGWLALGETLTLAHGVAFACAAAGVWLIAGVRVRQTG
jgi:drug/metabolite transporter (DMT)-like permease